MRALRTLLVAVLAVVGTGCMKATTTSIVGSNGGAVTSIAFEIDLGAIEAVATMFQEGFADAFGEEASPTDEMESPLEEMRSELDASRAEIEELYDRVPELAERIRLDLRLEGDTMIMEMEAFTETIEQLEEFLDSVIGTGTADIGEIFDFDDRVLDQIEALGADMTGDFSISSDPSTGNGMVQDVRISMEGGEFRFEATAGDDLGGGPTAEELEGLEAFGFDDDLFGSLLPQVTISITPPGPVIETNGTRDGNAVTWDLAATESGTLFVTSEVDDGVRVTSLDDLGSIASIGSGGGNDSSTPIAIVVLVVVALAAAVGGWIVLRRNREPATAGAGTVPFEAGSTTTTMPSEPPTEGGDSLRGPDSPT